MIPFPINKGLQMNEKIAAGILLAVSAITATAAIKMVIDARRMAKRVEKRLDQFEIFDE